MLAKQLFLKTHETRERDRLEPDSPIASSACASIKAAEYRSVRFQIYRLHGFLKVHDTKLDFIK